MSSSTSLRRQQIAHFVNEHSFCDVNTIIDYFNVSPATIRRDLSYLEKNGLLRRSHGVVHASNSSPIPSFYTRQTIYSEEKKRMGQYAAQMVEDGATVLIDGGTSTSMVLKSIPPKKNLTIISNSISVLPISAQLINSLSDFILLGGQIDHKNLTTYGPFAEQILDGMSADILFLGTTGILNDGLMTHNLLQANIKRKMIQRAKKCVLLADARKFCISGTFRFATFSDIDVVVTSEPIQDETIRHTLETLGVEVVVV